MGRPVTFSEGNGILIPYSGEIKAHSSGWGFLLKSTKMYFYLTLFVISFIGVWFYRRFAIRAQIMDIPNVSKLAQIH